MPEAQLRSTAWCLLMVDVCPSEDHDKLFPKLGCDVLPSSVTLLNCSETSFPLTAENHFCRLVKFRGSWFSIMLPLSILMAFVSVTILSSFVGTGQPEDCSACCYV